MALLTAIFHDIYLVLAQMNKIWPLSPWNLKGKLKTTNNISIALKPMVKKIFSIEIVIYFLYISSHEA
jgi:hypothetical protein